MNLEESSRRPCTVPGRSWQWPRVVLVIVVIAFVGFLTHHQVDVGTCIALTLSATCIGAHCATIVLGCVPHDVTTGSAR